MHVIIGIKDILHVNGTKPIQTRQASSMRVFTTSALKAFVMLVGCPFKYG
jgi:hypothetical protein